jgi:hypothetical protein
MKRLLWWFFGTLGLVMLAGLVVALRQPKPLESAPLTLPDGSVVRVVGVTYGTNHLLGPPVARLAARLPSPVQDILQLLLGRRATLLGSITTPTPKLVVWLGRTTNNVTAPARSGYYEVHLSDASGFVSGDQAEVNDWWINPMYLQFNLFPRRDPVITAQLFYHSQTGGVTRCGSLAFANPLPRSYPQWKPEPLPVTRRVGDLEATVAKLSTGHDNSSSYGPAPGGGHLISFGTNRVDGGNNTVCLLRLHALTHTNEVWCVAGGEVSDATGNLTGTTSLGWGNYEDGYFTFEPALWPSEAAWKLRCELKRAKGFAPGETFTFRDVPLGKLGATNRIGWMTNFGGVSVTLEHVLRRAPHTNDSWSSSDLSHVSFTTAGLGNGLHLDLLSTRTDQGDDVNSSGWSSSAFVRTYNYRTLPLEAKTADFTFAVQRSQWVEFMLKPEVGTAQVEIRPQRAP